MISEQAPLGFRAEPITEEILTDFLVEPIDYDLTPDDYMTIAYDGLSHMPMLETPNDIVWLLYNYGRKFSSIKDDDKVFEKHRELALPVFEHYMHLLVEAAKPESSISPTISGTKHEFREAAFMMHYYYFCLYTRENFDDTAHLSEFDRKYINTLHENNKNMAKLLFLEHFGLDSHLKRKPGFNQYTYTIHITDPTLQSLEDVMATQDRYKSLYYMLNGVISRAIIDFIEDKMGAEGFYSHETFKTDGWYA